MKIDMRVAVVNNAGFCNGGATTLCLQYAKLGFDTFFRNYARPNFCAPKLELNVRVYDTVEELVKYVSHYDRILVVDLWIQKDKADCVLDDFMYLQKKFPNLEICFVQCTRALGNWDNFLKFWKFKGFEFKHVFSLNKAVAKYPNSTVMDINAFSIPDIKMIDEDQKEKIIFSAGRIEGYKGSMKFFSCATSDFFIDLSEFSYVHEGAVFSFHKNDDGISCSPQCFSLFDITVRPKKIRQGFVFKHTGDIPDTCKFNIYPSYCLDDIYIKWPYYYVGVCFLFGTRSSIIERRSLFGNEFIIEDKRERKHISKSIENWNDSMEYSDIEKIIVGIPVLFSRTYANLLGFTDSRLIYDSFFEVPKKIKALSNYYEDARSTQYKWMCKKINNNNARIIKEFTKSL